MPSAAPSGALLGRVPLPHPPEAKGGVGFPPPAWSSRTGSGIVFLPIVPVPRPPPQVEGVLGRVQGARSELPDTRTTGVGAVPRMFTCEVSPPPPARFILVPAPGGRGQGGVILLCFRMLGGAELGRRRRVPREKGLLKSSGEELRLGERWYRGPGMEEREVWSFPQQHMDRELTP